MLAGIMSEWEVTTTVKISELFDLKNLNMSLILWILIRILIRPCFWIHIIFLNVNFRLQFVLMNRLGHILSSC